eukprot:7849199-Pyramimonas_sp.AAC.1
MCNRIAIRFTYVISSHVIPSPSPRQEVRDVVRLLNVRPLDVAREVVGAAPRCGNCSASEQGQIIRTDMVRKRDMVRGTVRAAIDQIRGRCTRTTTPLQRPTRNEGRRSTRYVQRHIRCVQRSARYGGNSTVAMQRQLAAV